MDFTILNCFLWTMCCLTQSNNITDRYIFTHCLVLAYNLFIHYKKAILLVGLSKRTKDSLLPHHAILQYQLQFSYQCRKTQACFVRCTFFFFFPERNSINERHLLFENSDSFIIFHKKK